YQIKYSLAEVDVAEISTASDAVTRTFGDLGAINFGIAVSATDGRLAVASTEARNAQRLEPRLRGHMVDTRLGFVTAAGIETVRDLDPHIDYGVFPGTP